MPLGFYLSCSNGRKPTSLPTHFSLHDFRKMIEKKVGNPEHYDYTLGDVIFRTWNEEVFNRQRSAIHDGITLIIEAPAVGPDAPVWRQPQPGLCLEGVCVKIQCPAFERKVIMNQGIGTCQVIHDSVAISSKCPCCSSSVQATFAAFYQCSWRVHGTRPDDQPASTEWQTVSNEDYYRWSENFSSWKQLTIETKK